MPPILANAGTPLMWAGMLHLLVGNLVIGIGEGLLLAKLFRLPRAWTIGLVTAGNYFSMIVGMQSMAWVRWQFGAVSLLNVKQYLALAIAAYFLMTVVLELPFIAVVFFNRRLWFMKSIVGSVTAQSASYGLLVPYYWSASGLSLVTDVTVQSQVPYLDASAFVVFYVDQDTSELCRVRADGSDRRRLQKLDQASIGARLFLQKSQDETCFELWLADEDRTPRLISKTFASADACQPMESDTWVRKHANDADSFWAFGQAVDLRAKDQRHYEVETGYWPMDGLRLNDPDGKRIKQFALETPFVSWYARCATVLPGNIVVYRLNNQVIVLEIPSRRAALLALGSGPVVVPEASVMQADESCLECIREPARHN